MSKLSRTDPQQSDSRAAENELQASDVGPGAFATFLYYFTSTTILAALVAVRGLDMSVTTGVPQRLGLMVGLLAGGLGIYFNRTATISIAAPNGDRTLGEVEAALAEIGYRLDQAELELSSEATGSSEIPLRVYQRAALGRLLSGRVYIQQMENQLIIASRAVHLRQLQRQLNR